MKRAVQLASLVFAVCQLLSAQSGRGTVCVAPNSPERPERVSPGGDFNPATLTIQIDKRQPIKWPHKESVQIADLDLGERHLIVLTSDGKRIQSFWFRFSSYTSNDLCVDYDGYQGVRLQEKKASPWCKCK
jgi:hypothetical protein